MTYQSKGVPMFSKKHCNTNDCKPCAFFRKSGIFLGALWSLVLISSLLYYKFFNSQNLSYWHCLNSTLFFINIPVFCYALLSFVAQRGLFNGIRYSLKQTSAFFFKGKRSAYMSEFSVDNEQELSRVLKEKYLYTSPCSDVTYPLLAASGLTFIVMILFAL